MKSDLKMRLMLKMHSTIMVMMWKNKIYHAGKYEYNNDDNIPNLNHYNKMCSGMLFF